MTHQEKLLWENLTKMVRVFELDNLHARELYNEMSKLLNMSDRVLLSITETENGLEVKIGEQVYDNLAIVGLLEKIKLNILAGIAEEVRSEQHPVVNQKYDA